MFENYSGNIISLSSNSQRIIAYAEPASDAVHLGIAEEGFADVSCIKIYDFDIERQETISGFNSETNRLREDCFFHVLYISPVVDLVEQNHESIARNLRQLLDASLIAPDLSEDELDTLVAEILREINSKPELGHAFYSLPHEVFSILKTKETVEYMIKNAMDLETSIITPLYS